MPRVKALIVAGEARHERGRVNLSRVRFIDFADLPGCA